MCRVCRYTSCTTNARTAPLRPKDVVSSGTRLRLLFHVLMVLSFGLELPQYFAWVTTPAVDIHVHTNKTHLESSHLRASTLGGEIFPKKAFGNIVNHDAIGAPSSSMSAKSRNMRLVQAKQRLLDKLVSVSYVHVCNFFHGVYHRYK